MTFQAMPDAETMMTRSEFARHLGVAKSYVTKLGNQGRLVLAEDGRVRVQPTLELIRSTTGAPGRATPEALTPEMTDWKERKERAQALQAEMDVAQRRGTLILASDVRAAVVDAATTLRTRLERLPDQLAAQLAAATDEQRVRALLANEIEATLADLSTTFGRIGRDDAQG